MIPATETTAQYHVNGTITYDGPIAAVPLNDAITELTRNVRTVGVQRVREADRLRVRVVSSSVAVVNHPIVPSYLFVTILMLFEVPDDAVPAPGAGLITH